MPWRPHAFQPTKSLPPHDPSQWLSGATTLVGSTGATWSASPSAAGLLARQREAERKSRMATPFLSTLLPSNLRAYKRGLPRAQQSESVSPIFLDAMEIREQVFVEEQGVPADNDVRRTIREEVLDAEGNVVEPRVSDARRVPVGTIRIVPFPHDPHPVSGAKYWGGKMEEGTEEGGKKKDTKESDRQKEAAAAEPVRTELGYFADRPTTFHDGQEPYVKLGRLAVVKEFRGQGMAGFLVRSAVEWLRENPNYFDPSVVAKGLARLDAVNAPVPQWKGLVCAHAQEQVAATWARWGFRVDEDMGVWWEEGIRHVGMFLRLEIDKPLPSKKVIAPVGFPGDPFAKMMKAEAERKQRREMGLEGEAGDGAAEQGDVAES
ncbi:unnamed protein product [Parascedosporium putredinis]|uniref:Uncharacterized protein n=1 Tax=Parascedosporium putredinis TaxID=1442378 RepID=A0A9P1H756_9PEZI|nr:unnamed protein product [Parascedosporium putredinis]CAI7999387.1 unnamed protein product [Parascedosporium putredinis]